MAHADRDPPPRDPAGSGLEREALGKRVTYLQLGSDDDAPRLTIEPRRFMRALKIVERPKSIAPSGDKFRVRSQSGGGFWQVRHDRGLWLCECPDAGLVRPCQHVLAVLLRLRILPRPDHDEPEEPETPPPPWSAEGPRFDWAAYNKAERVMAETLPRLAWRLFELLPQPPPHHGPGRPPIPQTDSLLCAFMWSIAGRNARQEQATRDRLFADGLLSRPIPASDVSRRLVDDDTAPLLEEALLRTREPFMALDPEETPLTLAVMGDTFAIDSTGFTPSRRGHYNHEKHGPQPAMPWLKCHLMISTKAHLITSARITSSSGENTHDTTQFAPLFEETKDAFPVGYVVGDGAYSGRKNVAAVKDAGAEPFFRPRKDTITKQYATPGWADMIAFFTMHRREFDAIYHRRSVIEGVNSSIKRRFGETLRSRTATSRKNELLCKLVAYNLTVLVQHLHFLHVEDEWLDQIL